MVGQPLAAKRHGVSRGPTASSSQLSFLGTDFLFVPLANAYGGRFRNMQLAQPLFPPFLSARACIEGVLQTVGSRGEQGCVPNNGDGREGRGAPAGPASLFPEAFQGPQRKEEWLGIGYRW